jgi:hypothetical protein
LEAKVDDLRTRIGQATQDDQTRILMEHNNHVNHVWSIERPPEPDVPPERLLEIRVQTGRKAAFDASRNGTRAETKNRGGSDSDAISKFKDQLSNTFNHSGIRRRTC